MVFIRERGMLCLIVYGALSGSFASPVTDSRKAVMRYNEKDEVEATGEWLQRVKQAGHAEELFYVPSQLDKLGVAPRDVVDALPWLRNRAKIESRAEQTEHRRAVGRASVAPRTTPAVLVLEKVEVPEIPELVVSPEPWDWTKPVELLIENSIKAIFVPDPELPAFTELASQAQLETPKVKEPEVAPLKRARGKRARTSVGSTQRNKP